MSHPAAITSPGPAADVVVPVYRGLDETRRCIESVLATVAAPHGIVVIDDCSPEPEVSAWLEAMAARTPHVALLRNPHNLGFVATVNRAFTLAPDRDVILLNSDTEVSGDWVGRMRRAAYSDPAIATVTPFSNNATICSWPRFCRDNPLPAGVGLGELDRAFAAANAGMLIDLPTGVGFAMYIRRDALDALGPFDEQAFGKGYGEENDFCRRAAAAGRRNVLLADTFIHHAGAVSFGVDRRRLEAATAALLKLHPGYLRAVDRHVAADPARIARWRAALSVLRHGGLPVLLFVTHRRGGGTLLHVEQLARHLEGRAHVLVLAQGDWNALDLVLPHGLGGDALPFDRDAGREDLLEILRYAGIDRVHLHHLLDIPDWVLDLPDLLGAPFDFTAHDFLAGCPRITLAGPDERRYCGQPADAAACDACLARPPAAPAAGIAAWRAAMTARLSPAARILAPSNDAARRLGAMLPGLTVRAAAHPDAVALAHAPTPCPPSPGREERLRVLVLGALSRVKGADLVEAAAREAARRGLPVEFHVLGRPYRRLGRAGGRLRVHGAYEHADLAARIAGIAPHVAWLPSHWPETYSYTLSEMIAAGLPVAVGDLGAPAERVAGRPLSWVLPWDIEPAAAADFFAGLHAGRLPAPPPLPLEPPPPADFYSGRYLAEAGLAGARPPRAEAPPSPAVARALEVAVAGLRRRQTLRGVTAVRQRLWRLLITAFSHPVLYGLVRRIPQSTRERAKRLIKG